MCLAIYKPAGVDVPLKHIENGFNNHSDGAGVAWAVDGVLHVKKGIFNYEEMVVQYEAIKQYPALIHFRKATHGKINEANCHPFLFNDGKYALIHNGVLNIKCSIDGLSDTAHFVKQVLEPLINRYNIPIDDSALDYLINTSIGSDKMAVMDQTGKTYIFNEGKGEWDAKVWYSNTSYKWSYKATTTTTAQTYGGNQTPYHNTATTPSAGCQNWRKHFTETNDLEDEKYLEFWKRSASLTPSNTQENLPLIVPNEIVGGINPLLLTGPTGQTTEKVDDAGNVSVIDITPEEDECIGELTADQFSEGQMCEYGWYEADTEAEVKRLQTSLGLNREEALIRIYNEK